MWKKRKVGLIVLIALLITVFVAGAEEYEWTDAKLKEAIESQFKFAIRLKRFDVNNIEDLKTQVVTLYLSEMGYEELPDLSVFESLQSLEIAGNPIDNLDALNGNERIRALDISETNITMLPYLPSLEGLGAFNVMISNLDTLMNLSSLRTLALGGLDRELTEAEVGLIEAVAPQLDYLHVIGTKFDSLDFLKECTNLKVLTIQAEEEGTILTDSVKEAIQRMPLNSLSLIGMGLDDISFLEKADRVRTLQLSNNHITDITPLTNHFSLLSVFLNNNQISDISALEHSLGMMLEVLDVSDNQISDLRVIEQSGAASLRQFAANNNQITDLSSLKSLRNPDQLVYLSLSGNQIEDVSPLTKCRNLKQLYLQRNKITDIGPLLKLSNLGELKVGGNPIENTKKLLQKFPQSMSEN